MHIRRSPSGDGPTIYRPNESAAMRLDPPPRPVANEPDSIPPPPRDSLAHARQPTAWPDPDRHGLDRRHRELRLGRVVGPQPGRQGRRQGPRAAGRAGADHAVAGQARECRRAGAAQPGQGSLQPHPAGRPADPAREAAAGLDQSQAAGQRPAGPGGAQVCRARSHQGADAAAAGDAGRDGGRRPDTATGWRHDACDPGNAGHHRRQARARRRPVPASPA